MTDLTLAALLVVSLLFGHRQWRGRRLAEQRLTHERAKKQFYRTAYATLQEKHARNESIFRQMRRIANQPEN